MKSTQRHEMWIGAPVERVWSTMLGDAGYRDWTSVFAAGSYYEGSWSLGSRIRFLIPSGDGMVAEIAEFRLHEFLSIRHLGMVKDGVEDTTSPEIRAWTPSYENYTFVPRDGGTAVLVDLDVTEVFADEMAAMWPTALARLKALCEA